MEYTEEMYDLVMKLERLRSRKRPPGTKIHYAEVQLERLKDEQRKKEAKTERKKLPRKPSARNTAKPAHIGDYTQNRAYVLSRETYDLTQAMVALERLR